MKQRIVKYGLRLTGLVILALMVLQIVNVIFAFRGNPLALGAAERKILRYADENFGKNEFIRSDCMYRFKDNDYYIEFKSRTSPDTQFRLFYNSDADRVITDEYEERVVGRKNTVERLTAMMEKSVRAIFDSAWPVEKVRAIDSINVIFSDGPEKALSALPLDASLSDIRDYPVTLVIRINVDYKDDFEMALNMRMIRRLMIDNRLNFDNYTFIYNRVLDTAVFDKVPSSQIAEPCPDEQMEKWKFRDD
ncbi:MAG: hypothetical protein Q4P30_01565 [Eubacteriales bacterium]|nr:hypothetical protein [Eubacteriales bacterium]